MPFQIDPSIPVIVDGRKLQNHHQQLAYENSVADILKDLSTSKMGRAVIDEVVSSANEGSDALPGFVTIEPQRPVELEVSGIGLIGKPEAVNPLWPPPKTMVKWKNLTPEVDFSRVVFYDKFKTVAKPQSVFVLFTPGYGSRLRRVLPGWWNFFDDHSSLLHELFHAVRILQGKIDGANKMTTPSGTEAFENREEFYAVIIQNIYLSERGHHALRENYNNKTQASNYLSSAVIVDKYEPELSDLVWSMCQFSRKVAAISCAYNPIRQFVQTNPRVMGIDWALPRCR